MDINEAQEGVYYVSVKCFNCLFVEKDREFEKGIPVINCLCTECGLQSLNPYSVSE